MPIAPEGIIKVDELRREIGDPTKDSTAPGWMGDNMLQDIIDRNVIALFGLINQRLIQMEQSGVPMVNSLELEKVSVDVAPSDEILNLSQGTIEEDIYPWAFRVTDGESGRSYFRDDHIELAEATSYFAKKRYTTRGSILYITPPDSITLTMWAAKIDDIVSTVGAEFLTGINDRIKAESLAALQARVVEGTRLLQTSGDQ